MAVIVAQLIERLLPTSKIHGSNPDIGEILSTNCTIEKTKIKKIGWEWTIFKKTHTKILQETSMSGSKEAGIFSIFHLKAEHLRINNKFLRGNRTF